MEYKKYELTQDEIDRVESLTDDAYCVRNLGWDKEFGCSNAASYSKNILGYEQLENWTNQMLDSRLKGVIKKTAFNIVKKIPFEIKKTLFLEYKGNHHNSKPTNGQTWDDTYVSFYGLSDYLRAHQLTIKEANRLLQLSHDVENGDVRLEEDYFASSKSNFINFIG